MKIFNPRPVTFLFVTFVFIVVFLFFSFGSCTDFASTLDSNLNNQGNSSRSNSSDDDDDDDDDRDDPEDCEENEGDPCRDNESCEQVCESIYEEWVSIRSCISRGDETVGDMEKVHNLLMGKKAGIKDKEVVRTASIIKKDLAKFSNDDDDDDDDERDVDNDDLKCYLQIGSDKYIQQIERGFLPKGSTDTNTKRDNLVEVLRWLVTDQESAEVLQDINAGDNILKTLLETLESYIKTVYDNTEKSNVLGAYRCIDRSGYYDNRPQTPSGNNNLKDQHIHNRKDQADLDQAIWWIRNDNLKVRYNNGSEGTENNNTIELSDHDLFGALSCFHKIDNDDYNIFTYSAKEDNEIIFKLAFDLLERSCRKAGNQQAGCFRSLICWSSWQQSCFGKGSANQGGFECTQSKGHTEDRINTKKLWSMVSDFSDDLEKESSSDYDDCTAKGFYDFFK